MDALNPKPPLRYPQFSHTRAMAWARVIGATELGGELAGRIPELARMLVEWQRAEWDRRRRTPAKNI